jgi:5-methylcytosine-specific restriction protein A
LADKPVPSEILSQLFHDEVERKTILTLFKKSADLAQSIAPNAWSATLFHNAIRLNVGQAEALTINAGEVRCMLKAEHDLPAFAHLPIFKSDYKSVSSPQCIFVGTISEFIVSMESLSDLHFSHVNAAARTSNGEARKGTPHRVAHSFKLMEQIEIELSKEPELNEGNDFLIESKSDFHLEGRSTEVQQSRYERDPRARKICLAHYGNTFECIVCMANLQKIYGEIGKGYIQVHHLYPVSTGERATDPVQDLIPVCPNCHAMLHREDPPIAPEILRRAFLLYKT